MSTRTLTRNRSLTRAQLHELRAELERACQRYDMHDSRGDAFRAALQRMDDGDFGICITCGNAMPYERLSVVPETLHCVTCPSSPIYTGGAHAARHS